MKTNQNPKEDTYKVDIKKNNPLLPKSSATGNDKGEEYIGEGHGHDYSQPVAGEDGGTEEQSDSKSKKSGKNSNKIQH